MRQVTLTINSMKLLLCSVIALLSLSFNSFADTWQDDFRVNGFFTLDASITDADLRLVSNSGVVHDFEKGEASLKSSLLGAQVEYLATDDLSVYLQSIAFLNEQDDVDVDLDWAYLSYDFGYDFKLRAGKFLIPALQGIELRNVGFSRLWARPLIPHSGAGGYTDYMGVELLKGVQSESAHWLFQVSAGKARHGLNDIDNKNIGLVSAQYARDDLWVRGSVLRMAYSFTTPRGVLVSDSAEATIGSLEIAYTPDPFLLNAGISLAEADITPNDNLYYLSLGVRINSITPFIYGSRRNQHFDAFEVPLPENGQNQRPPPSPPDGDNDIFTYAAGMRWDVNEQYAVKVQAEHVKLSNRAGMVRGLGQGNARGSAFSVLFEGVF